MVVNDYNQFRGNYTFDFSHGTKTVLPKNNQYKITNQNTSKGVHKMKDITLMNQQLTMSSLEIAELCSKRHKNVMRDIDNMLNELKSEPVNFASVYIDAKGEKRKYYQLPKDETLCLITGYRADIRMKVIRRWQELENKTHSMPEISLTDQINEISRKVKQISDAGSKWGELGNAVKKAKRRAKGQLKCLIKEAQMELKLEFKQEVSQ